MIQRRGSIVLGSLLLIVFLLFVVGVGEGVSATQDENEQGRVPRPVISRGQGESCVDDTDYMRRNHMKLLMHQRDETVLKGIRTKQYSLKECVACHAVPGPDAIPVTAASPEHFCRSCHDYAAVQIDCFQCHASRPDIDDFVVPE